MLLNTRLTICVGLFVLGQLVGCGVKPEANSGGDAYRHTAEQMVMEEWVDGEC